MKTQVMQPHRGPDTISHGVNAACSINFIARDIDKDGDIDFVGTRGNSAPYDGVFWLEQVRTKTASPSFVPARSGESPEIPLP